MAGSEMRKAELLHSGEKLEEIMEALGAKPVKSVNIEKEPHKFNQGECYMIQQANGREAVVYKMARSHIVLQTEFELI
ncbi:hypothetical protein GCK72_007955 [Caenorhabditis remanei]|uniref:Uncharacterized protein n=1 Tax=Caenorhabditis remanei TaxID=31234 RepID=A0A6A5HN17_CAERE|nr:hypothetical protein GCK72_007955 [Caenorhabditis remanei]KAF1767994.1 hypothetical protein GCK72_007955 [Caenorhabditis remanei]